MGFAVEDEGGLGGGVADLLDCGQGLADAIRRHGVVFEEEGEVLFLIVRGRTEVRGPVEADAVAEAARSGKGEGVTDSGRDVGAMENPPEEAAA